MEKTKIERKKEQRKQYYLKNRERILAKQNDYYSNNKQIYKNYYENNKDKIIERQTEYNDEYHNTPNGRASTLLSAYNASDKKRNRGKGDLTVKWIVENIFSKPCAHCGKTGWEVIGCNRLNNDLPHTKDNVEPCCGECNIKMGSKELIRDEKGKWRNKKKAT